MTHRPTSRRTFLCTATVAAATAGIATQSLLSPAESKEPPADLSTPNGFKKSVKIGMVKLPGTLADKMKVLKELGFDGIELNSPGGPPAEEVQAAIDTTGLPVHGVVDSVHWQSRLSDPNPAVRAKGLAALETAIRMSKAYGGTTVLLVPGRVIVGEVTYEECWQRSQAEIKKAIPLAEELGIQILMENVWNDFLTDPKETARFLDELESDVVGAYFDVGNTVRYSPPHEWVPILGKRIKKLDIKDFGKARGFGHDLLEGDVDWQQVMSELKKIGYVGWGTAEIRGGDKERLAEIADKMNQIFAKYPA